MKVSLIAAVAQNGVIGRDGDLPWKLPADLRRFRELTTGHHIIMGRKTHASIGRALPQRTNLVLSRRAGYEAPGCTILRSLEAALENAREAAESEVFVIGGAAVYRMALPRADRIYLTEVEAEIDGDVHFPDFEGSKWRTLSSDRHEADEQHLYAFAMKVLERAPD